MEHDSDNGTNCSCILGTIVEGLERGLKELEIRERIETNQTTALLRTARILRRDLGTCCYSDSSERPPVNASVKNSMIIKKASPEKNFCLKMFQAQQILI